MYNVGNGVMAAASQDLSKAPVCSFQTAGKEKGALRCYDDQLMPPMLRGRLSAVENKVKLKQVESSQAIPCSGKTRKAQYLICVLPL